MRVFYFIFLFQTDLHSRLWGQLIGASLLRGTKSIINVVFAKASKLVSRG